MESITFLTRHYPPSFNINGESVCDLVDYIEKNYSIPCNVIHVDQNTSKGGKELIPKGNVTKIPSYFAFEGGVLGGLKSIVDGFLIINKARKKKNTFFVVTSSPPLMLFWASIFLKSRRWAFWALDLFPEIFHANGEISNTNPVYKWLIKKSYSAKPDFVISLGPNQAKYISTHCYHDQAIKSVLLPCGYFEEESAALPPNWYEADKIIFGYCGNVHLAHNPQFIMDVIDALDPSKHKLILSVYGSKAKMVLDYAEKREGVYITNTVPRSDLRYIDIHMVSLLPKFTHLAVPSKAVSAISMGKTVLFAGSRNSDNWTLLKEASWLIEDNALMRSSIYEFCNKITKEEITEKQDRAHMVSKRLKKMVNDTYNFIPQYIQRFESNGNNF